MAKYRVHIGISSIVMITCFLFIACGEESTRLEIVFGQQPEGGVNITLVQCVIVGRLLDGDTPIRAHVKWHGEDLNHQNYQEYWSDTWTFRSTEAEELGAGVQDPDGLAGYFWFEVTWEDEDGTPNAVVSDTAVCTYSPGMQRVIRPGEGVNFSFSTLKP